MCSKLIIKTPDQYQLTSFRCLFLLTLNTFRIAYSTSIYNTANNYLFAGIILTFQVFVVRRDVFATSIKVKKTLLLIIFLSIKTSHSDIDVYVIHTKLKASSMRLCKYSFKVLVEKLH